MSYIVMQNRGRGGDNCHHGDEDGERKAVASFQLWVVVNVEEAERRNDISNRDSISLDI